MMAGAAASGPGGLTTAACVQLAQDIVARGALYATFTTVAGSFARTSATVCGGRGADKDNLLKGPRASQKCIEHQEGDEDGVEMVEEEGGLMLVEVPKGKQADVQKEDGNGVLSNTVEYIFE
jgi:hypothetical protein